MSASAVPYRAQHHRLAALFYVATFLTQTTVLRRRSASKPFSFPAGRSAGFPVANTFEYTINVKSCRRACLAGRTRRTFS